MHKQFKTTATIKITKDSEFAKIEKELGSDTEATLSVNDFSKCGNIVMQTAMLLCNRGVSVTVQSKTPVDNWPVRPANCRVFVRGVENKVEPFKRPV